MVWKFVGIALMCISGVALASSPAKSDPPAEAQAEKAPNIEETASERRAQAKQVKVCRTEAVTGSRFSRKICHTREEWDRMKEAGVETVKNIQKAPIPLESN